MKQIHVFLALIALIVFKSWLAGAINIDFSLLSEAIQVNIEALKTAAQSVISDLCMQLIANYMLRSSSRP